MYRIDNDASTKLKNKLDSIAEERASWRALCFSYAAMADNITEHAFASAASNVIEPLLKQEDGSIFYCEDGEIVVLSSAVPKKIVDTVIDQMTYLFADYVADNSVESFCTHYDLSVNWDTLYQLTHKKCAAVQAALPTLPSTHASEPKTAATTSASILETMEKDIAEQNFSQPRNRDKPCVLVVEDDPLSQRLVGNILKKDHEVINAATGLEAYDAYLLNAPDIVFMDIGLPDTNGHQLLKRFIKINPDAYIIMLSGNGTKEAILTAMQLGAKGFVGKPFSQEKLLHYISLCPTLKELAA